MEGKDSCLLLGITRDNPTASLVAAIEEEATNSVLHQQPSPEVHREDMGDLQSASRLLQTEIFTVRTCHVLKTVFYRRMISFLPLRSCE